MSLTTTQRQAVEARGDTLVMAGAGTGKTHTLVEACVQRLLREEEDIGIDEILMVTFTEAAAAEIRQRIRLRLEAEGENRSVSDRLQAQLAALDSAHISTLHSFCMRLLREHFHELEIDPEMNVLAAEQSALLASETLDEIFERHYWDESPESEAVRRFLLEQTRGWEDRARDLILEIHHFTQTRPDPAGWFEEQLAHYAEPEPHRWRRWLGEGFLAWRAYWLPELAAQEPDNSVAAACLAILQSMPPEETRAENPPAVERVTELAGHILNQDAPDRWTKGKKTKFRKPLEQLFADAAFLHAFDPAMARAGAEPLAEDWHWVREPMTTLVLLAKEFAERFARAKRARGGLDFHDLEQMTLRLLWDARAGQPTELAEQWRRKLKLVYVDEYQDINEAQDTILRALSREGNAANRFLVGDVKQSIYRFRQAAPHIFQNYAQQWTAAGHGCRTIFLQENFRSREMILRFVNEFFGVWMRAEMGGVAYDELARLSFGAPEIRHPLAASCDDAPRVELLLHLHGRSAGPDVSETDLAELTQTEAEARRVGQRLRQLKEEGHEVWDHRRQTMRPVEWSDMVVLLRSPKAKVESFAKVFARLDIPLEAKRTGFFDSIEVQDLLNLLVLLDNPLQDLPVAAVLRSPLGGLSVDDLAHIRLAVRKVRFWTALRAWHREAAARGSSSESVPDDENADAADGELFGKVDAFLARFDRWRAQARHASLTHRLEMILAETHYLDWLLTQDRGEQRRANVRQLLGLAREFDELHAQGLHRFLKMIEAQKDVAGDREPAPLETGQAVRLMSIHQSKGLEFPVVAIADLGKRFNLTESRLGLVLDETWGLCPRVHPPGAESHYPSLPLWLSKQHQRAESLGEEMRILYVAMTRAQDTLILSGSCSSTAALERWAERAASAASLRTLLQAGCYLDWLGPWLTESAGSPVWAERSQGRTPLWSWRIPSDEPGPSIENDPRDVVPAEVISEAADAESEELASSLRSMLDWKYPFDAAMQTPAKTSVTALRRQWNTADEEASPARFIRAQAESPIRPRQELGADEVGLAHHKFLEWVRLDRVTGLALLEEEARRLQQEGRLSQVEQEALNLGDVAAFWESELGREILTASHYVERELPFTCRLSPHPLAGLPPDDFMVVQGVADLVVLHESEIWIVDFKTDHFPRSELADKVALYTPQLQLYGLALGRIYARPVTRLCLHFLAWQHTAIIPSEASFKPN